MGDIKTVREEQTFGEVISAAFLRRGLGRSVTG